MPPDKQERTWALRFAILVMLATTVPYFLGYAAQGQNWRFTGFVFGVEDGNSYIAKMLRGATGEWLFRTPYTTSPQRGILAFLPYLLLGKLASPPGMHEQLTALYHLFRIGAGILAILATYDFLALFLKDIHWRKFGLLLATLGGGLGWVLVTFGQSEWLGSLPLEFYSPESFGFLSLFGLPHLGLVRALLLWGFVAYLNTSPRVGLLWLLLGLVQPLYVVVAWAVAAGHLLILGLKQMWRMRQGVNLEQQAWQSFLRSGLCGVALSSPAVVYTLIASQSDPFFKAWTAQNLILSPHPLHYLLAYGLIGFAILACLPTIREQFLDGKDGDRISLLVAWILLLPFLVYAPYPLQRRLAEGAWVALVGLASVGLVGYPHIHRGIFLILLLPSTILLWFGGILSASQPALPLFRPAAEISAFDFIAANASPDAVVLAAYETGNALPAWAPARVIIGHGPESPGLAKLKPRLEQFFSIEISDMERSAFLKEFQVSYVIWGPAEQALGAWDPSTAVYLKQVYKQADYQIFAIQENQDDE